MTCDNLMTAIEKSRQRARQMLDVDNELLERAWALHREAVVCDCFCLHNMPVLPSQRSTETWNRMAGEGYSAADIIEASQAARSLDLAEDTDQQAAFLTVLRASGVTGFAVPVASGQNVELSLARLASSQYVVDRMAPRLSKALCAGDIRKAKREDRHVVIFEVNSPPLTAGMETRNRELRWLEIFRLLGVRVMHLTYNRQNLVGCGCTESRDYGLSDLGREVVQEMNRIGIMVDVPHSSRQTVLDACETSTRPVIASHTVCRGLHDHVRGRTDEEIRAIAATGGLVGILSYSSFLSDRLGTLEHMLDHIDHAVSLVGVEHVGIGTDNRFVVTDNSAATQKELPPDKGGDRSWWTHWLPEHRVSVPECREETGVGSLAWTNWPYFTAGLVKRGYGDDDIRKILGLNFLRVFEACCG